MGKSDNYKSAYKTRASQNLSLQNSNNCTKKLKQQQQQLQTQQQQQEFLDSTDFSKIRSLPLPMLTSTQLSPGKKIPVEYSNLIDEITKNIKSQLENWFSDSLAKHEEELNLLKASNTLIEQELNEQKDNNKNLRDEIDALKNKFKNLEEKLEKQNGATEHLIQEKHFNVCVLSGPALPLGNKDENCINIVNTLIKNKLKINLPEGSITNASRIGYEKNNKPDKRSIRFNVRDKAMRSELIKQSIQMKGNIYINEFLSSYKKKLLFRALELKNDLKIISTCFIRDGILNVGKIKGSKTTKIFSFNELDEFLKVTNITPSQPISTM